MVFMHSETMLVSKITRMNATGETFTQNKISNEVKKLLYHVNNTAAKEERIKKEKQHFCGFPKNAA